MDRLLQEVDYECPNQPEDSGAQLPDWTAEVYCPRLLQKTVLTWNSQVGGLLLKNRSVQLLEKSGEFNDETGDAIILFRCRSLFFRPSPGSCLARVKDVQADSITLNVLNLLDVQLDATAIDSSAFVAKDGVI